MKGIAGRLTEAEKQRRTLAELLEGNFCVGEAHQDISPKRFLIENMKTFKKSGFSVLFMEHLAADRDLDERLSNLDFHYMDDKSSEYNFTNVVKAAQENEIEIVCLEESNDIYHEYKDGAKRMVSLNYNAREVIAKKEQEFLEETRNALKWFAFVGSAHLNTYYGVPGICEIIPNVQDVLIADSGRITEGLEVSMFINGSSDQDMTIASILDRQRNASKTLKLDNSEGMAKEAESATLKTSAISFDVYDPENIPKAPDDHKIETKKSETPRSSAITPLTNPENPFKKRKVSAPAESLGISKVSAAESLGILK
jgi:hypothetical protein